MTTLERLKQLNRRDDFLLSIYDRWWVRYLIRKRALLLRRNVEKLRARTWDHYMERQPRQNADADEAR
jgi:hypothetical protein